MSRCQVSVVIPCALLSQDNLPAGASAPADQADLAGLLQLGEHFLDKLGTVRGEAVHYLTRKGQPN